MQRRRKSLKSIYWNFLSMILKKLMGEIFYLPSLTIVDKKGKA
jgi:hypothetical protein